MRFILCASLGHVTKKNGPQLKARLINRIILSAKNLKRYVHESAVVGFIVSEIFEIVIWRKAGGVKNRRSQ